MLYYRLGFDIDIWNNSWIRWQVEMPASYPAFLMKRYQTIFAKESFNCNRNHFNFITNVLN